MFEQLASNTDSFSKIISVFAIYLPRSLIFIFFFPLFYKGTTPGLIKSAVALSLILIPVSAVVPFIDEANKVPVVTLITVISELILGTFLGLTVVIPYVIFKGFGALIDVYRGATFAAQASGSGDGGEELPLEQLFGLLFAALVFAGPGLHAITKHLIISYSVLPPGQIETIALTSWMLAIIRLAGDYFILAFLLSAPILMVVLMVEVAMEVLAAFTPQMQVYSIQFGLRSIFGIGALMLFLQFSEREIFVLLDNSFGLLSRHIGDWK